MDGDCISYTITPIAHSISRLIEQAEMSYEETLDAALNLSDEAFRVLICIKSLKPESKGFGVDSVVNFVARNLKKSPEKVKKAISELTKKGYYGAPKNSKN